MRRSDQVERTACTRAWSSASKGNKWGGRDTAGDRTWDVSCHGLTISKCLLVQAAAILIDAARSYKVGWGGRADPYFLRLRDLCLALPHLGLNVSKCLCQPLCLSNPVCEIGLGSLTLLGFYFNLVSAHMYQAPAKPWTSEA